MLFVASHNQWSPIYENILLEQFWTSSNYGVSWKKSIITLDYLSSLHFFISTLKHSPSRIKHAQGGEERINKER